MDTVLISDANIFIDLYKVGLLNDFFLLPCKMVTTDLVLNEVITGKKELHQYQVSGRLEVITASSDELVKIVSLMEGNLSLPDCSILYFAGEYSYILITGEKKLRQVASKYSLHVHGVLYVLDLLVNYGILSTGKAIESLLKLLEINPRLPIQISKKKILDWKNGIRCGCEC